MINPDISSYHFLQAQSLEDYLLNESSSLPSNSADLKPIAFLPFEVIDRVEQLTIELELIPLTYPLWQRRLDKLYILSKHCEPIKPFYQQACGYLKAQLQREIELLRQKLCQFLYKIELEEIVDVLNSKNVFQEIASHTALIKEIATRLNQHLSGQEVNAEFQFWFIHYFNNIDCPTLPLKAAHILNTKFLSKIRCYFLILNKLAKDDAFNYCVSNDIIGEHQNRLIKPFLNYLDLLHDEVKQKNHSALSYDLNEYLTGMQIIDWELKEIVPDIQKKYQRNIDLINKNFDVFLSAIELDFYKAIENKSKIQLESIRQRISALKKFEYLLKIRPDINFPAFIRLEKTLIDYLQQLYAQIESKILNWRLPAKKIILKKINSEINPWIFLDVIFPHLNPKKIEAERDIQLIAENEMQKIQENASNLNLKELLVALSYLNNLKIFCFLGKHTKLFDVYNQLEKILDNQQQIFFKKIDSNLRQLLNYNFVESVDLPALNALQESLGVNLNILQELSSKKTDFLSFDFNPKQKLIIVANEFKRYFCEFEYKLDQELLKKNYEFILLFINSLRQLLSLARVLELSDCEPLIKRCIAKYHDSLQLFVKDAKLMIMQENYPAFFYYYNKLPANERCKKDLYHILSQYLHERLAQLNNKITVAFSSLTLSDITEIYSVLKKMKLAQIYLSHLLDTHTMMRLKKSLYLIKNYVDEYIAYKFELIFSLLNNYNFEKLEIEIVQLKDLEKIMQSDYGEFIAAKLNDFKIKKSQYLVCLVKKYTEMPVINYALYSPAVIFQQLECVFDKEKIYVDCWHDIENALIQKLKEYSASLIQDGTEITSSTTFELTTILRHLPLSVISSLDTFLQNIEVAIHFKLQQNSTSISTLIPQVLSGNEFLFLDACKNKNLPLMQYCLSHGANINVQDKYQRTALHIACTKKWTEGCNFLIENGIDVSIKNFQGRTALQQAVMAFNEIASSKIKIHELEAKQGFLNSIKYLLHQQKIIPACFFETPSRSFYYGMYVFLIMQSAYLANPHITINKLLMILNQEICLIAITNLLYQHREILAQLLHEKLQNKHEAFKNINGQHYDLMIRYLIYFCCGARAFSFSLFQGQTISSGQLALQMISSLAAGTLTQKATTTAKKMFNSVVNFFSSKKQQLFFSESNRTDETQQAADALATQPKG